MDNAYLSREAAKGSSQGWTSHRRWRRHLRWRGTPGGECRSKEPRKGRKIFGESQAGKAVKERPLLSKGFASGKTWGAAPVKIYSW